MCPQSWRSETNWRRNSQNLSWLGLEHCLQWDYQREDLFQSCTVSSSPASAVQPPPLGAPVRWFSSSWLMVSSDAKRRFTCQNQKNSPMLFLGGGFMADWCLCSRTRPRVWCLYKNLTPQHLSQKIWNLNKEIRERSGRNQNEFVFVSLQSAIWVIKTCLFFF